MPLDGSVIVTEMSARWQCDLGNQLLRLFDGADRDAVGLGHRNSFEKKNQ